MTAASSATVTPVAAILWRRSISHGMTRSAQQCDCNFESKMSPPAGGLECRPLSLLSTNRITNRSGPGREVHQRSFGSIASELRTRRHELPRCTDQGRRAGFPSDLRPAHEGEASRGSTHELRGHPGTRRTIMSDQRHRACSGSPKTVATRRGSGWRLRAADRGSGSTRSRQKGMPSVGNAVGQIVQQPDERLSPPRRSGRKGSPQASPRHRQISVMLPRTA